MNAKTFEQFSPRDQEDLRNVLLELQKLDPPKHLELKTVLPMLKDSQSPQGDGIAETSFDHYEFFLGRAKQFRITRIK